MTERTRIILGMSLIELDQLHAIGGVLPPMAMHRLSSAKSLVEQLLLRYGERDARSHCPHDHKFLISGTSRRVNAA